jgi:hypothetical protein
MEFLFGIRGTCTYCGEPSDIIENCLIYSWVRQTELYQSVNFKTPICRECNSLKGNRRFKTFQEKALFINNKLRIRHRKEMGVMWDDDELNTTSGRLKEYLRQKRENNKRQRERVSWQSSTQYFDLLKKTYDDLYYNEEIESKLKLYLIDEDYTP